MTMNRYSLSNMFFLSILFLFSEGLTQETNPLNNFYILPFTTNDKDLINKDILNDFERSFEIALGKCYSHLLFRKVAILEEELIGEEAFLVQRKVSQKLIDKILRGEDNTLIAKGFFFGEVVHFDKSGELKLFIRRVLYNSESKVWSGTIKKGVIADIKSRSNTIDSIVTQICPPDPENEQKNKDHSNLDKSFESNKQSNRFLLYKPDIPTYAGLIASLTALGLTLQYDNTLQNYDPIDLEPYNSATSSEAATRERAIINDNIAEIKDTESKRNTWRNVSVALAGATVVWHLFLNPNKFTTEVGKSQAQANQKKLRFWIDYRTTTSTSPIQAKMTPSIRFLYSF